MLTDTTDLERELTGVEAELDITHSLLEQAIQQNATQALNQQEYQLRFQGLAERFEKASERHTQIQNKIDQRSAKRNVLTMFFDQLRTGDILTKFDPEPWIVTVDKVIMRMNGECCFRFKNGSEITV